MAKHQHVPATSTALSIPPTAAIAAPSYIEKLGKGLENVKPEDLKLPFLRLAQDVTPLVKEGKIASGNWFNSVTGTDFGKVVEVVPVCVAKGRAFFEAMSEGGGILCQSADGLHGNNAGASNAEHPEILATGGCPTCPLSSWTRKKKGDAKPPACAEQGKLLVCIPGTQAPMVLCFQNMSYPAYRTAASIMSAKGLPAYANVLRISSKEKETASGNTVHQAVVEDTGRFPTEDEYKKAEALYNGMKDSFNRVITAVAEE